MRTLYAYHLLTINGLGAAGAEGQGGEGRAGQEVRKRVLPLGWRQDWGGGGGVERERGTD